MTNEQIQDLTQLKELKEQGILTQEEFEKEKTSILNGATSLHQVIQDPQDKPNSIPNNAIQKDKTTRSKGEDIKPIVKKEKSWFARNWTYIAFGVAMALVKLLTKLV